MLGPDSAEVRHVEEAPGREPYCPKPGDNKHPKRLTRDQLITLVKAMDRDWDKLNEIHNQRAKLENWCSGYEGNQHVYNADFTVLKLKGRPSYDDWDPSTLRTYIRRATGAMGFSRK